MTVTEHATDQRATDTATPLVRVRDLRVDFGSTRVVDGIDFDLLPGRCHALVGESGSGKSVTARTLVGLTGEHAAVTADALEFAGQDLLGFTSTQWRALRGNSIGLVLQDALVSLDPLRTIHQEVGEAIDPRTRLRRATRSRDRVTELLADVGIPDPHTRLDQYPHELSGGLRQRALIATAVARDPAVIIADEPTTALDTTVQRQILELLRTHTARGTALLLISHDLSLVAEIADQVSVLHEGVVVEQGTPAQVFAAPAHPYTRRLLRAVPTAAARGYRLAEPPATPTDSAPPRTDEPSHARIPLPARRVDPDRRILVVTDVGKTFRGRNRSERRALDKVGFEVSAGETLGIVGESGSGKTTLLRILLGLLTPDTGTVYLDGELWNPRPERQRRPNRHRLQLISQDPLGSFDPRYPVGRLLTDGIAVAARTGTPRHTVDSLLESVGLPTDFAQRYPRHLSGGQRQRVAIARALAADPEILICDEPVSALDVSVQAQVLDLIADVQHTFGTSVVFVSHDLGVIHHVSDRVLVLDRGTVVESGDVTEVYRAPRHPYTRALLDAVPTLASAHR
ncbi:dipeptide ABC transporter ATP-binding protein [Nocardia sp. NPDC058176]|uniref:dipeptide ABC transporter ATP-binding protein n=1 Tax=Nocardia sp. NPDC058176 TaxID=3346368 RepID=UPI0036DD7764